MRHKEKAIYILLGSLFLQSCSPPAQSSGVTQNANSEPRQQVDLIIGGDYVVSMEKDGAVYKDAAIAVDDGLIIAIGSASEISSAFISNISGDWSIFMIS